MLKLSKDTVFPSLAASVSLPWLVRVISTLGASETVTRPSGWKATAFWPLGLDL